MATGKYTLGKHERLKSRKQIERLFKEGKSFVLPPFRISYFTEEADKNLLWPLQFGVGAGTRSFKKAVDRNRVKRLVREAWRLQKNILADELGQQNKRMDVFMIYTGRKLPNYSDVYEKTGLVIKKLLTKTN